MTKVRLIPWAMCMLLIAAAAWAESSPDEVALKKRFEERYLTLLRLKDQGKVGEAWSGFTQSVQANYLSERIDPSDKASDTIREFLGKENADRRRLYLLIAERSATREDVVARRNAQRLFGKASPNHYLKLADGRWVQRKDLRDKEAREAETRVDPR